MRLSVGRFNAQLQQMGQTILWRPAYFCPCRNPDSGAPAYGCPVCGGTTGYVWGPAVSAWAGVSGVKVAREWAAFGLWESGDIVLSIGSDSPAYAAGQNDRIVMSQSTEPFSLSLTHDGSDALTGSIVSVTRVFWIADGVSVEGGIPQVSADGTGVLTWTSGEPPAGVQYSITGRQNPEFFLFKDLPQDRAHFGGEALPRRVALRRFDVFGRTQAAGG